MLPGLPPSFDGNIPTYASFTSLLGPVEFNVNSLFQTGWRGLAKFMARVVNIYIDHQAAG